MSFKDLLMALDLNTQEARRALVESNVAEIMRLMLESKSWFKHRTIGQAQREFEKLDEDCEALLSAFSADLPGNPAEFFLEEKKRIGFDKEMADIKRSIATVERHLVVQALERIANNLPEPVVLQTAAIATREITECLALAVSWEHMRAEKGAFFTAANPFDITLGLHSRGVARVRVKEIDGSPKAILYIPVKYGNLNILGVRVHGEPGFRSFIPWPDPFLGEINASAN